MKYAVCAADTFSLGAGYLISHLRWQGHEVKLVFDPMHHSCGGTKDTLLSRMFSVEDYNIKKIKEFKPDAVLFSVLTAHYQWALRFSHRVKQEVGSRIVFGGVHATSVPRVVRKNWWIDDVVEGCFTNYFGGVFDPDNVFPEREDFYRELPPCHREHPFIMTDFGCPFSCTYCLPRELKITTKRRTVESCIRELRQLERMGARRFSIWDDAFTRDYVWLEKFLAAYRDNIRLPFRCLTHPKLMNARIALMLKHAGCYTIDMGIQTGNERLRREVLNRHETNEEFIKACDAIRGVGIKLVIDHIFEIPGETDATNEESLTLYRRAKPDLIHCFKLLYFPRAKIIDTAIAAGILREADREKIEEGKGAVYASGEHQRVADVSRWVKKMLAVPLGGGMAERAPDWLIKLLCYIRIGEDFLPQTIIEQHIFWTWLRFLKWTGIR